MVTESLGAVIDTLQRAHNYKTRAFQANGYHKEHNCKTTTTTTITTASTTTTTTIPTTCSTTTTITTTI